jgi:putative hydrolase of the HAD superfamily
MHSFRKFKAVLFDLGGTLIKTLDAPEIYRRILEAYGVNASLEKITRAHKENEKEFRMEDVVEMGNEFWIQWNERVLERLGINENKDFLARKIDESWWNYAQLEAYPDVATTISQLKEKKVKIGIVTNGFEKDYLRIIQRLGWSKEFFDVIVGIDACRKAKPHKEIFLYAVRKLSLLPEETIFVGDSLKYDYEGAKKAGLHALLLNRKGERYSKVKTIRSLTEVLSHV